jgi:predicted CopG family antitoxin
VSITRNSNKFAIIKHIHRGKMTKVIKVQDSNYKHLLSLLHELENSNNQRASFDDVISLLIQEHDKKRKVK